ncbi:hypothetical protein [Bosea psychrotolerans]|uniref:hypothetical protein n=1 Tax=Bosea psychrotolerans TaxID=1871628 RepID=UPI0015E18E05|nr:hypothetical protein [Bosea psychrotolerans]
MNGDQTTFIEALGLLKTAEERVGDLEISQMISRFERCMAKIDVEEPASEFQDALVD